MPTANLGMTLPSNGSTGWGTTINANLELIDDAFEGLSDSAFVFDDSGGVVTIALGSASGTKIGTATTQKLGFFNATPVVQPAHADQAAMSAPTQQALTDSTGGTASTTLATISDSATANALASVAARLGEAKNDVLALRTLANRLRSELVTLGLIKGSA